MTPGPLVILLVGLPAVAPPLGVMVIIGEVHLFHVVWDHNILTLRKEALQLREEMLRKPALLWELHLREQNNRSVWSWCITANTSVTQWLPQQSDRKNTCIFKILLSNTNVSLTFIRLSLILVNAWHKPLLKQLYVLYNSIFGSSCNAASRSLTLYLTATHGRAWFRKVRVLESECIL